MDLWHLLSRLHLDDDSVYYIRAWANKGLGESDLHHRVRDQCGYPYHWEDREEMVEVPAVGLGLAVRWGWGQPVPDLLQALLGVDVVHDVHDVDRSETGIDQVYHLEHGIRTLRYR